MVKILFDHNMPPVLARAVHQVALFDGHEAFALRDMFPINITDVSYFDKLGAEDGWIVISKDLKNARKRAEREAILRNKLVAFYLSPALQKKHMSKQAASIFWHWEGIIEHRSTHERGLFQLPENKGQFKRL